MVHTATGAVCIMCVYTHCNVIIKDDDRCTLQDPALTARLLCHWWQVITSSLSTYTVAYSYTVHIYVVILSVKKHQQKTHLVYNIPFYTHTLGFGKNYIGDHLKCLRLHNLTKKALAIMATGHC